MIKLSHKKFRAVLKKLRRKRIRQEKAKKRAEENGTDENDELEDNEIQKTVIGPENERLKIYVDDAERESQHELWLERERKANEEFQRRKEKNEKIQKEIAEKEKKIREEWEVRQKREKEEKDKSGTEEKLKKEREAALFKEISTTSTTPKKADEGPIHNPEAPPNYGTELDRENCPFFIKTGACRFGDRCSRHHNRPQLSNTVLIPNMYNHFSIDESFRDEYDTDIGLEYEDNETYNHFREFYEDVVPEFKKIGRVVQFKTCCNHEPHLRGNVYIQYRSEADALEAFSRFNGRYYAGKQLSCEFTNIAKWKTAICGLFARKRCPKGKSCNFLHVFKNPRNEFHLANFDYEMNQNFSTRSHSSRSNFYRNSPGSCRSRSRSRSKSIERSSSRSSRRSSYKKRSRRSSSSSPDENNSKHSDTKSSKRKHSKKKSKKHKKKSKSNNSDKAIKSSESSSEN